MRHRRAVSIFIFSTMVAACGGSDSGTPITTTPDSGVAPQKTDAALALNPFAPATIESVLNQIIAAVEAKGLSPVQKPPIAVVLKQPDGFFAPIVVGANRMSTRLGTPSIVQAPFDPNEDKTAPDALDKSAALQNQYITSLAADKIYKGMAYAPQEATGDSITVLNSFVNTCGPVVTIDSDIPDSTRSYLIATANYQAGATAAKKLLEVVKPGDAVLVFGTTLEAWVSGIQRAQGAIDTLKAAGVIIPPKVSPTWDDPTDTQNLITALSDPSYNFTGMVCMYANSFDCAAAVESLGKKDVIKIVGFDMEAKTKTYFDMGYFHGIAVQRQYYMGQVGVLVPYAINVLGAAQTAALLQPILVDSSFIDTGIDLITVDNYAAYMTFLSELGINQ